MAYSFEMVLVGMILLSAMVAGGAVLMIKRRREASLEEPFAGEGVAEDAEAGGQADTDAGEQARG